MERSLKYQLNFVVPCDLVWPELKGSSLISLTEEKLSEYSVGSQNGWLQRTCYHLREIGEWPTISPESVPNAINVFSPREFGVRNRNPDHFVLIPRADCHRPFLADYFFEQNPQFSRFGVGKYLPYWPQANILPRPLARGSRIERISFKGRIHNIDQNYRSEWFRGQLALRGIRLDVDGFNGLKGDHSWGDYRETDLVLAVRNLTVRDAAHKPASKLINAWIGAAPALLGPEPAFNALRKSELDFLEVTSPKGALEAIDKLVASPRLYQEMVENGTRRGEEFTVAKIVKEWINALNGPIGECFEGWRRMPSAWKWVKFGAMIPCDKVARRYYGYYIRNGKRLMLDQPAKEYW